MPEVVLNVVMTCSGCSNAVNRALNKLDGVENVSIDMEAQKVTVTGTATSDAILAAVQKTGKEVSLA